MKHMFRNFCFFPYYPAEPDKISNTHKTVSQDFGIDFYLPSLLSFSQSLDISLSNISIIFFKYFFINHLGLPNYFIQVGMFGNKIKKSLEPDMLGFKPGFTVLYIYGNFFAQILAQVSDQVTENTDLV